MKAPRPASAADGAQRSAAIVAEIVEGAGLPLERARTLPPAAYTDEAFFELERDRVLARGWHAVAHVSQVPQTGDYLTLDLLGEPLVVVRGADGEVRVLSRTCRHRWMDVVGDGTPTQGNARHFRCPYHLWTYNLEGRLTGAPEMAACSGFDKTDYPLVQFRTEVWQGFVFVTLDDDAAPVADSLADLAPLLDRYDAASLVPAIDLDWPCTFNWKVLAENFMEIYHHIGIHRATLEPIMPAAGGTTPPGQEAWVLMHVPYTAEYAEMANSADAELPAIASLEDQERRELRIVHVYPTMLLALFHDRIYWFRILPEGARAFSLKTLALLPPATAAADGFAAAIEVEKGLLCAVHNDEDLRVCAGVGRGVESRRATAGRLHPLEAPLWEFQRYLARKLTEDLEPGR